MDLPYCNPELIRKEKEEQIALNKTIRKDLDEVLQKFRNGCHEQRCWSHEREVAIDKIIEAMMWLGKDLARIGTPDPYPTSRDPEDKTVHPTADGLKM